LEAEEDSARTTSLAPALEQALGSALLVEVGQITCSRRYNTLYILDSTFSVFFCSLVSPFKVYLRLVLVTSTRDGSVQHSTTQSSCAEAFDAEQLGSATWERISAS
jgi:hypothetical protein